MTVDVQTSGSLIPRVKNILLTPAAEWQVIDVERTDIAKVLTVYVLPLAGASALAAFIGSAVVGQSVPLLGSYRLPFSAALTIAAYTLCAAVIGVFVMTFIINALAPTFAGQKDTNQAFKVAAYAYTPTWVGGLSQILPFGSTLIVLAGAIYALYLVYLGLPRLMKSPQSNAVGYTATVVVCAIVLGIAVAGVSAVVVGSTTGFGSAALGSGPAAEVAVDPDSPLGKLEQLGKGLEESARKAEAAQAAGDPNAQAAAAMAGIGALLGGGARVEPLDITRLKTFVPDSLAGLPRRSSKAEKTGFGVMVSRAEGVYGDGGQKEIELEVLDTGGVSGLMGLASWMGVEEEKESDDGYERTKLIDGRMTREKVSKSGANEFALVLGDRFMVSAKGRGVDVDALKTAVSSLDLRGLEALKSAGVEK